MARSKKLQDALNRYYEKQSQNPYDENKIKTLAAEYTQREATLNKLKAEQESAAKNNAIKQSLNALGVGDLTGRQKLYSLASSMYNPNSLNGKALGQSGIYQGRGRTFKTRQELNEAQKAFERKLNTNPITSKEAKQLGKEHPVWGSGLAIASDTIGSAAALGEIAKSKITGQPIDMNSQLFKGKTTAESYKEGAKERIGADKSPMKNFLYETGMSTVESGLRALTMGPAIGAASAGVQAGTSAFLDAKQRGASDNRAIAQGLAQGVAESFFEKFSLEGLKSFKTNPADSIGQALVNVAKQGFTEGSEEFATDWANAVSDYFIMGGDSVFNQRVEDYKKQGLSEKQAVINAIQETLSDSLVSFAGGALSGIALGGGAQVANYSNNVAVGNQLQNTNNTFNSQSLREIAESVVDDANAYKNKSAAEQAQNTKNYLMELSKKEALTPAEQGAALNEMRTLADMASGNMNEEISETKTNEGFADISENDEKLAEKIQETARLGKTLSGVSAELMSDSIKDYNPDTVIKAARSINDAVKYSGISASSFGDMISKGAESDIVQSAANNINVQMLSASDREALYKAALNDRLTFNNKYTFKQGNLIPSGISEQTVNTSLPVNVKGIVDDFGKAIGSTVSLSESLRFDADGLYNTKTGDMMLSFNADAGTAFHEITHMVRVYSPENYKDIAQSAVEAYIADYGKDAFDKKIESIIDNYESQTGSLYNYEDAEEEFVADTMKAFADKEYAAEFAKNHMTLAEKFKNLLKDICDMMNRLFDGYKDTEETLALKNHKDLYEKAYKGLSAGIEEARSMRESGYSAVENIEQNNITYDYLIAKPDMNISMVKSNNSLMDRNTALNLARNNIYSVSENGNSIYVNDLSTEVVFGKNGITHGLRRNKNNYIVSEKIGEILKNSIRINELKPREDTPNGSYITMGIATDEIGDLYPTIFIIKKNIGHEKDTVENIEVLSVYSSNSKKIELRAQGTPTSTKVYAGTTPSKISIKDLLDTVKGTYGNIFSENVANALGFKRQKTNEFGDFLKYSLNENSEKNLVAIRNVDSRNLESMLELEGLPSPSIAVTKADIGHTSFGDVTFLFDRSTIDPEADNRNLVFDADAWTPLYPGIDYEYDKKVINNAYNVIRNSNIPEHYANQAIGFINKIEFGGTQSLSQILNDAKYNTALKEAFLASQGKTVPVVIDTQKTEFTENEIALSKYINEEMSKISDELKTFTEKRNAKRNAVKDGLKKYLESRGLDEEMVQTVIDNTEGKTFTEYANLASEYKKYGNVKEIRTENYNSTNNAIDAAIDKTEYEKWLNELFDGLVLDKGIRNNKEIYTKTGNRRSFKQTHDPASAENIVKKMWEGKEQGAVLMSGFTAKSVRGAAAKKFSNVDEMHKESGRLQNISEGMLFSENEKNLLEASDNKMKDIRHEIYKRNNMLLSGSANVDSIVAFDNAYNNALIDAAIKAKSAKTIQNQFLKEKIKITESESKQLFDIFKELRNLPTDYFEAKPKRVVGWNEIKAAIVPDDIDNNLLGKMIAMDIPVYTYESGNDEQRKRMINEDFSAVKFSLKADAATIRDLEESNYYLGRMNEEINDAISNAKAQKITEDQISQIADKYIKKVGSNIDKKTVIKNLSVMYDYINNTAKANARQLSAAAKTLAEDIMDASVEKDDSFNKAYPNLRKELNSYRMTLTEEARKDMAKAYDSYGNFRKKTFGMFTLVKDGTKSDVVYGELSEKYPDLFPADIINEADQVIRMTEVGTALKPTYRSVEYGDDYDSIAYTIGQELIAEYFNANADPEYLNRIEKIKQDMRAEFAERENYLKKQKLEDIKVLTEKYNNAQGELKAKYKEQIKRLRSDARYNLEKLNEHYRQIEKIKSVKKFDREARQKLLKAAQSLSKMKGGQEFEAAKNALIGDLDLIAVGMRKDTREALMKLREEATNQAAVDKDYAETEFAQLSNLFERLNKKQIKDMSGEDVAELTQKIIALKYAQQTYQRTLREDLGQYIATLGRKAIEQQNNVKGIDINNQLKKAFGTYKLYMLDPMRGSAMLDGYQKDGVMSLLAKGLNDGQTKSEQFIQKSTEMFNEYLRKHKEFADSFSKPDIPITVNGRQYMISKGMRISMYLHSLNNQNMRHIRFGGLQVPDAGLYEKGRYTDAYTKTKNLTLKPSEIEDIISGMTAEEKSFADIAYKFFNETTKNAINETSMVLNGYEKATVNNYFPIRSDPRFIKREISGLVQDGTIEGMGMLKERTNNAANPVLLEDVAQVIMRQMQNTARYYGLAVPVRDFNKVFDHTSTAYAGSVKNSISDTWGNNGVKYVSDILTDIQGGRNKSNFIDVIFNAAKGFHAQSVLTLNPSVAIKQSASYPFALTVLDTESLGYGMTTAFKKADYDYMDSITPWGWARRQGMSGTEVGEVYKQKTVTDTNSTIQSIKNKLNWIQMIDVWTTDRLFFATEYYVKKHNPSLEARGTEYNKKVADLYNTVLQRTQPSYDVMQRNAFLRDPNALLKTFTAFKTQTFNMGGELIDAWSRAAAYKSLENKNLVTKTDVESANQQLYRTVGATVMSQGMLTILAVIANAVLHKPKKYRDEEGNLTPLSVFGRAAYEFMTSFAGMMFLGSEAQTLALAATGKERLYDITPPQLSTVNDLLQAVTTWSTALGKVVENNSEKSREALKKATVRLGMYAGAIKGIPSSNIYNIANAVNLFAQDIKNGTLYESGEGLFGLSDTSVSKKEYMLRMTNRLDSNDYEGYITEYNKNVVRFGEDEVTGAIKDYLKESDAVMNAAEDWKIILYGTDRDKMALKNKVSEDIGKISKTPSVSDQIDSVLKSLATKNRNEDDLYKEVKAINDKWEGSSDKDKSEKKKAEIRKLMRGRPKDERRIIWRLAGYSDSTFK